MTFTSPVDLSTAINHRLRSKIIDHSTWTPRSRQTAIGLSEIGDPCSRKLGYKTLGIDKTNTQTDPWPMISGSAIHEWLAECFGTEENYLVEYKVTAAPGLSGTADLFDIANQIVIDHKCVGTNSMKKRIKDGLTQQQRVQLSMYALGFENIGHDVKHIACAYYPLGGRLDGLHVVVEEYDRQVAIDAMERHQTLLAATQVVDISQIPAEPSDLCVYCPWYLPGSTDLGAGCPGQGIGNVA
jgi:hypothetical protein